VKLKEEAWGGQKKGGFAQTKAVDFQKIPEGERDGRQLRQGNGGAGDLPEKKVIF